MCAVCYGTEATLPSECPGRALTSDEMDKINAGHLDYKDGKWQEKA